MKTAESVVNKEKFKETTRRVLREKRPKEKIDPIMVYQLITVGEELGEIQKEISKFVRGENNVTEITEEIADIHIVLENVKLWAGITDEDVNKAINVKIDRINESFDNGSFR